MKFFSTTFIALLASASLVAAQLNGVIPNPQRDQEQFQACKDAANADHGQTFAGVRYGQDGPPVTLKYGKCIPLRDEDGNVASTAVFCRSATCTAYKESNCKGVGTPISPVVPTLGGAAAIPAGIPNALDFGELLGTSVSCTPNSL